MRVPTYRVIVEGELKCNYVIIEFIGFMMDNIDPVVNYQYDFLEVMNLIDILKP